MMRAAAKVTTTLALVVATALTVAGCSTPATKGPAWTADPGASGATSPTPSQSAGTSNSPDNASVSPSTDATTTRVATAAVWKNYTDSAKRVSFDLPQDWIAQSVPVAEGTLPGAIAVEVKKPDGTFVAALKTGLPPSSAADCPEASRKTYTVISSVPVDLPTATGDGVFAPRVVFRVIQGYRYFGSYGITNVVGGAENQACELRNTVRGPASIGDYSFGDIPVLRAFATDEKVAPAKAFDTLSQAATYVDQGSEFAIVQRMLMSLKVTN
ncbi:hypothetical protein PSET11_03254 [Arthrobacter ulcerisalmonis]|uniref:Gram-negative bacterial tonB protein n=1 Tax=Arthrobacter ulcerisalmonis TaxID=2483813 RepID=A0A3P5XEN3_9MICC|nr:hypothetical protein PSET11_03254 [Arthrobacter ulcerisalmonis]